MIVLLSSIDQGIWKRRRTQNRLSQLAWRSRREKCLIDIENQLNELNIEHENVLEAYGEYNQRIYH